MRITVWKLKKREIHCHTNFFPPNQFKVKFFSKRWFDGIFAKKIVAVKFRNFHSVRTYICMYICCKSWFHEFLLKCKRRDYWVKQQISMLQKITKKLLSFVRTSRMYIHIYVRTLWKLRNFTATIFFAKIPSNQRLLKNFTLNWFGGKNLCGSEFLVYSVFTRWYAFF